MRTELNDALTRAWQALGACGVWWTGEDRLAIAREARSARACALCDARKRAPIPQEVAGAHAAATLLSDAAIEAIHRVVSDPGRLSSAWYERTLGRGLTDAAYIELMAVVALTTAVDIFNRASGAPLRTLPAPGAGQPSRRRPMG